MTARPRTAPHYGPGIEISAPISPEYAEILTPEAIAFVARLQRAFTGMVFLGLGARLALTRR